MHAGNHDFPMKLAIDCAIGGQGDNSDLRDRYSHQGSVRCLDPKSGIRFNRCSRVGRKTG